MRRDNVEHLVLSAPDGASVIEAGIRREGCRAVKTVMKRLLPFLLLLALLMPHAAHGRRACRWPRPASAAPAAAPANGGLSIDLNGSGLFTDRMLQIVALITVLSIAPSIIIMMTSFVRIVVVLSLLRTALGLQQSPPNSVIVSLAMFLTLFVMTPTLTDAYQPGHQAA